MATKATTTESTEKTDSSATEDRPDMQHFDGTVQKTTADGKVVMSSYVEWAAGEKLVESDNPMAQTADDAETGDADKSGDTNGTQATGGDSNVVNTDDLLK